MIHLIEIRGLKALDEELKALPMKIQKKILVGATAKGANVFRDAAKVSVPVAAKPHYSYPYVRKSERLRRIAARMSGVRKARGRSSDAVLITPGNIQRGMRAFRVRDVSATGLEVRYAIGPAKKKGTRRVNDPWYWRFLEFGTKHLRGRRFLRNAFTANVAKVIEVVRAELERRIGRSNNKLGV